MKNSQANKPECTKRVLKPVIEKKRRDRINQKLHELRILLLRCTQDKRLQNPKLEKAEILDLAVLYLRRDTENQTKRQEPLEQHSPAQDTNPVFMTGGSQGQFSPIYTAGFHQCLSNVSTFVTNIGPSEVDPEITNLRVCLDSHFSSSGSQGHRKGHHLPMSDGPTGSHHGPLPASEQLTPPHSPSLSCSSPNNSSLSSPSANPLPLPYDRSSSHSASLYSLDSCPLSLSSSSPAMALSSMSHLPVVQSPSTPRRQAVVSPLSSTTWRPWN